MRHREKKLEQAHIKSLEGQFLSRVCVDQVHISFFFEDGDMIYFYDRDVLLANFRDLAGLLDVIGQTLMAIELSGGTLKMQMEKYVLHYNIGDAFDEYIDVTIGGKTRVVAPKT